jgi:flagellar motor switch protein FliN
MGKFREEEMSDVPSAESSAAIEFCRIWADALAQVLQQISGSAIPCRLQLETPAGAGVASSGDLCLAGAISGPLRGELRLRTQASSVLALARIFIGDPSISGEITAEHREAVLELMRQVGGIAATALTSRWGQTQVHLDCSDPLPSWPESVNASLQATGDAVGEVSVELQLSAALAAALKANSRPAVPIPESVPIPPDSSRPQDGVKLDLLMDVELGVTLRFGQRRMLLREILELSPGAVIELDRPVNEPVDVLLDGRVVAKGDVVVLDGNYGLRVTEIGG